LKLGFDAINDIGLNNIHTRQSFIKRALLQIKIRIFHIPRVYKYSDAIKYFCNVDDKDIRTIPTIIPNWDHTPRSGVKGIVLSHSTPLLFKKHVERIFEYIKDKPSEECIVFIKSWNEWAEGNYLEPDIKYGRQYLENLKDAIDDF
jgi:hypothetical protein